MKHTIQYTQTDEVEKRAAAMADIRAYLADSFDVVHAELAAVVQTTDVDAETLIHDLRLPLSFAGIQGYPVRAWVETLFAELRPGA